MAADSVLEAFEVQLADGQSPVYRGGEVIRGKIHIRLRKQITVFAVRLQIKGRAAFLNDPKKKADIEKIYFDQDMALLERPPGKPDPHHFTWISNFDYHLPFEVPLPKGCPTSFEGPHGFIRYFIKASLVEEDGSDLKEYFVKNAFSIVSPSDGHVVRGESVSARETLMYGKCCCKGKVTADLELPKTGYLPGESVYGKLKLDNRKPKELLSQMEVRLVDRVHRVGSSDQAASPYRTLYYRKLEQQEAPKGAKSFEKDDLFLLTIPPVPPTTKGDFAGITDEMHQTPTKGKFESPSTATLRFRKIPFLRIEYALQVSLGNHLLLEVPIQIGELKTQDSATILRPFIAGAQPIEEADEAGKVAFNGPFTYTPMYPYAEQKSNGVRTPTATVIKVEEPSDELKHAHFEPEPTAAQTTIRQATSQPDENTTVQTTVVHTETPDGYRSTETKTTTITKTISEEVPVVHTIAPEDIRAEAANTRLNEVEHHEQPPIEPEVQTIVHHEMRSVPQIVESPPDEPPRESPDLIEDPEAEIVHAHSEAAQEKNDAPATTVSTTQNDDGVTTVTTETFTDNGVTTVRTTTVTKHPDGSETTHVHEESSQENVIITNGPEAPQAPVHALLDDSEPQEGDETYTQTETSTENGVTTIRTTTVTKHADGSESTRVHEESHSQITESS